MRYSKMMMDKTIDIPIPQRLASLRMCSRTVSKLNIFSPPHVISESQGEKEKKYHSSLRCLSVLIFPEHVQDPRVCVFIYYTSPLDHASLEYFSPLYVNITTSRKKVLLHE